MKCRHAYKACCADMMILQYSSLESLWIITVYRIQCNAVITQSIFSVCDMIIK